MTAPVVRLVIELPEHEAWAFAQFLKRAGHGDYRALAADDQQAYEMQYAAETIRKALAESGSAPPLIASRPLSHGACRKKRKPRA